MRYDVCVLGAGPAGFAAAMRAWDLGQRVALVEEGRLGGVGLHDGALSSKTMWELSRDYRRVLATDRGYRCGDVTMNYAAMMECVTGAIRHKEAQMARQLEALAGASSSEGPSLTLLRGRGRFDGPHTVSITAEGHAPTKIEADHFVIATGSRPRILPTIDVDGHRIVTSDHIGHLPRFPESLVVLGAGVVGCEFATIFANFQRTRVYLIDRAPRILPFEDEDIAGLCAANLERQGATIHRGASLKDMRVIDDQVEYTVGRPDGSTETLRVEHALISVGRIPNTDDLNLERAGLTLSERGHIEADDTRTQVSHIYAAGDVTYDIALVSVGEIEGRRAAERIAGHETSPLSYDHLSTIMFLDPEVAAIGMNEKTARERRIPYRVARYGYDLVNRAIAMRATDGFVKLLVADDDTRRILGMRAVGVHASTSVEGVSLAMAADIPVTGLAELIHPHPAVTEGLQECVRVLLGSSIYKPHVFGDELHASRVTYADDGSPIEELL